MPRYERARLLTHLWYARLHVARLRPAGALPRPRRRGASRLVQGIGTSIRLPSMSEGSPLAMYRAVQRYIIAANSMLPSGPQSDAQRSLLLDEQAHHIITCLPKHKVDIDHATSIFEAMREPECPFNQHQVAEIAACVKACLNKESSSASHRPTQMQQSNKRIERYITRSAWDIFTEPKIDFRTKMDCMGDAMMQLGLTNPNEITRVRAVATLHLAAGMSPSPGNAYDDVRAMASIMMVKRQSRSVAQTMSEFPTDPKD